MANIKISELGSAAALTGTEAVPIVQSGSTLQTTVQDIADLAGSGGTANYATAQIIGAIGSPSATYDFTTLFPTVTFTNRTISMTMQIVISGGNGSNDYGSILYNLVRNNNSFPMFSYSSAYSSQTNGSVFPSFIFGGTEAAPTVQFYISGGQTMSVNFTIITV